RASRSGERHTMRKNSKRKNFARHLVAVKPALPAIVLAAMSATASAALNVYESFNYSTGQLQGNTNAGGGTANGFSWLQADTGNTSATGDPSVTPGKIDVRVEPTDGTKYNLAKFSNGGVTADSTAWGSNQLGTNVNQFVVASMNPSTKVFNLWINPKLSRFS